MGDSTDNLYGPQYLIQEDIVVVTFNYRLGPLGKALCLLSEQLTASEKLCRISGILFSRLFIN